MEAMPSAVQVPEKPLPTQFDTPVQSAVAAPPFVYPDPAALTATEDTPFAWHVPSNPLPLQPATPAQLALAAPWFVYT